MHSTIIVLSEVKTVILPIPMIASGMKKAVYESACRNIKNAPSMIINPVSNVLFLPIKSVR